ncbi:hypothetical protein EJB05_45023, partial [Eragrostis curvula]
MSHPPRAAAAGGGKLHPPPAFAHLLHRPLSIASPLASACIHRFATRLRPLLAYTACRRSDPPFAAQVHFSPPRRATSPPLWLPSRQETHGSPTDCPNDCEMIRLLVCEKVNVAIPQNILHGNRNNDSYFQRPGAS